MLTLKLWWEQCRQTGSSCQVCDSVTLSVLTHSLCHLCQTFVVCGLSFCSAAFEHCFWERGVELVLREALVLVLMGVTFSLVGGAKCTLSHQI